MKGFFFFFEFVNFDQCNILIVDLNIAQRIILTKFFCLGSNINLGSKMQIWTSFLIQHIHNTCLHVAKLHIKIYILRDDTHLFLYYIIDTLIVF